MKYVILRRRAPQTARSDVDTLGALQGGEDALSIEIADLAPVEAAELDKEPDTDVALSMPISLVGPVGLSGEHQVAGGDAWGVEAVGGYRTAFSGEGVAVAVLDTGIDVLHPSFEGMDLKQRDFSGSGDGDRHGHGTHCAGTIFGRNVNGIRIGVAPSVERAWIGKVLDDKGHGRSEAMFSGLKWAMAKKANVISMSLGLNFRGMVAELTSNDWPDDLATSVALEAYRANLLMFNAIMGIARAGAPFNTDPIVVAAAGNESRRSINPEYRIAASIPAACEGVIAVSALGRSSNGLVVADFSNSRPVVAAPGVEILSAAAGGGLRVDSGTSMACPHVAGVAALWWEALQSKGKRGGGATVGAQVMASAKWDGITNPNEADVGLGLVNCP